jgi:hypothetical protein
VVSEPNRRVTIAQLSGADAEELYVMRIALEVDGGRGPGVRGRALRLGGHGVVA